MIIRMLFDLDGKGLHSIFRPYQVRAWNYLVHYKIGTSREIYDAEREWAESLKNVDEVKPVSRASIINFLKFMAEQELLSFTERAGKGGYHRVYTTSFTSMDSLKTEILRRIITSANRELKPLVGS